MVHPIFSSTDSLVDLVNKDFTILPILSRFSIPLGFGTKSIEEVCKESGIDTDLFLLIVNFILTGEITELNTDHAVGLVNFLQKSHDYFMVFKFPHIRSNLLNALDQHHDDINPAIVRFFDDYVDQAKAHFEYEENKVFPYIRRIAEGEKIGDYSIQQFSRHHEKVSEKLEELKNIILRYYSTSMPNLMYDVLVDLYSCQNDLENHNEIENSILIPISQEIEKALEQNSK